MWRIIDVQIGEIRVAKGKAVLKSKAIGSCIAIAAYDTTKNIGALAHVMLPGRAPAGKKGSERTKYATDAIEAMVRQMNDLGSRSSDIEVVLVGGANVLNRKDDTICKDNIKSTLKLLREKQMKVKARAIGGTNRRSVSLDVEHGSVSYTESNGGEMQLWKARKAAE